MTSWRLTPTALVPRPAWTQIARECTPHSTMEVEFMGHAVTAVSLPIPSLVERALEPTHYVDAFAVDAPSATFSDVDALARASARLPRWVNLLMALRNGLVRVFGLKTEPEGASSAADGQITAGSTVGIFHVLARSSNEILMGLDDKHLDFRFSLLLQTYADRERAIATTSVRFNNSWGRLYFAVVRPFHTRIIPAMLRSALKARQVSARAVRS